MFGKRLFDQVALCKKADEISWYNVTLLVIRETLWKTALEYFIYDVEVAIICVGVDAMCMNTGKLPWLPNNTYVCQLRHMFDPNIDSYTVLAAVWLSVGYEALPSSDWYHSLCDWLV